MTQTPDTEYMDLDAVANAAYWAGAADNARRMENARKRLLALKGQTLTVVKGRKVPLGTTGKCFFSGEGKFGWRVGLTTADGETVWVDERNTEVAEA